MNRNTIKIYIIWIILVLSSFLARSGHCATYYVDYSSGSNSSNGLTESTAWKTLDYMDDQAYTPGDNINLKKGEEWRETLTVPSTGDATGRITIGTYDTGADPIINGADIMTGWTQLLDEDIWYTPTATSAEVVIFDTDEVGSDRTGEIVSGTSASTILVAEYDWSYSDGDDALYIYSEQDPDNSTTYAATVEASQRIYGILFNKRMDFITIDGIHLKNHGGLHSRHALTINVGRPGAIGEYWADAPYSTDNIIRNCTFTNNKAAICVLNAIAGTGGDRWLIENNTIVGIPNRGGNRAVEYSTGIYLGGASNMTISNNTMSYLWKSILTVYYGSYITIDNNDVSHYGELGIDMPQVGGDYFTVTNNTLRYPEMNWDAIQVAPRASPQHVLFSGNKFYQEGSSFGDSAFIIDMFDDGKATIIDNYVEGVHCFGMWVLGGDGHTISRNRFKDCGYDCYSGALWTEGVMAIVSRSWIGSDRMASNHVVSYNILDNCSRGIYLDESIVGTPSGHKFYNNVIKVKAESPGVSIYDFGFKINGTFSDTEFKNNIIYDNGGTTYFVVVISGAETGFDSDNNLFYGDSEWLWVADGTDTTLAEWQAGSGGDADSKFKDPLFKDPSFQLSRWSPAIDKGIYIKGLDLDFIGRRIDKLRPDIGPYEFIKPQQYDEED